MSFADLGLIPELQRAVAEAGYTTPPPIQAQAVPAVLAGGDIKVSGTAYFKFLGLSVPISFESTKQVSVVDEAKKYISGKLSGQSTSSYQTPSVQTGISLQASSYTASQGQSITFSGRLTDSNGNGISSQLVEVKRDITLAPDSILG